MSQGINWQHQRSGIPGVKVEKKKKKGGEGLKKVSKKSLRKGSVIKLQELSQSILRALKSRRMT